MDVGPQLIAREMVGDPILCYAEASDTLLVTGTAMGTVSVWDKRMGSNTADRVCQLTPCGEEAVLGISVHSGNLHATFGPVLSRTWPISELGNEEKQLKTFRFRRNDNHAMRHATHVVQGDVNALILTQGQGWSHLINLESQRDIKPALPCETGSSPSQLVNHQPSGGGEPRLTLVTSSMTTSKRSQCCAPLFRDHVSCKVKLWDVMLGNEVLCIEAPGAGYVRKCKGTMAICNGRCVDLYSCDDGKHTSSLSGHKRDVRSVDACGEDDVDGGFVTLGEDRRAIVWKANAIVRSTRLDSIWSSYTDEFGWVRGGGVTGAVVCTGDALYLLPHQ